MAEKPTSSSTIYTTFGAPSGAFGGSNGDQSGTESRISTLIVPLNGSLTGHASQLTLASGVGTGRRPVVRSGRSAITDKTTVTTQSGHSLTQQG